MSADEPSAHLPDGPLRLFFASVPDDESVRDRVAAVADRLAPSRQVRWVKPARWHVTALFLGDFPQVDLGFLLRLKRAGDTVRVGPFAWHPDLVTSFAGRQPPCVLRRAGASPDMDALHAALVQATLAAGVRLPEDGPYVPHLTLGYARGAPVAAEPCAALAWPVTEFVLLASRPGAPRYDELARWVLSDA